MNYRKSHIANLQAPICLNTHEAIDLYRAIANINIDEEMRATLHSYYDHKWITYYNDLCETAFSKPNINRDDMSPQEYDFYRNLLHANLPYSPYKPTE